MKFAQNIPTKWAVFFADCFSAKFAPKFPAKILRNRPIFPRICPWNSCEMWLFFRNRLVTPPKQVTTPSWRPPPPCKQALSNNEEDVAEECKQCIRLAIHAFTKCDREAFSLDWVCYLKLEMNPRDDLKYFWSVTSEKMWEIISCHLVLIVSQNSFVQNLFWYCHRLKSTMNWIPVKFHHFLRRRLQDNVVYVTGQNQI